MSIIKDKKNSFSLWFNSVDRVSLFLLGILIKFSMVMVATASPAVAERIGVDSFYFIKRQLIYLLLSVFLILSISNLNSEKIKLIGIFGFLVTLILLVLVLFKGAEIKGAKRWLYIGGMSMQPSEIAKPFFVVVTGYILSKYRDKKQFLAYKYSFLVYILFVSLLILQPDFGMSVTVSLILGAQLFLAGLSILFIFAVILFSISGFIGAYFFLPHVAKRINDFLSPDQGENYQIKRSLEAFLNGRFFGKGPGEGTVKQFLPDSHTDFIFAVIGEEFGSIVCFIVILVFAGIVLRGFHRIAKESDLFIFFSVSGLLIQFGFQAIINMGVSLNMFPTKGMTLPFISYGGSSMISSAIGFGMILALTKKSYGIVKISGKEYKLWVR